MVENANILLSPEENNHPSPLHLSTLNTPVWRGCTPINTLESGLSPASTGLCKSTKYAKKLGNKWVFFTGSFIPLQILQHSCNCTWPTSVHIWSKQHLYGIPTNKDLSTPLRECRNLHLRCGLNTGALIMSLCCNYANCPPLPAEDTTWNCVSSIKLSMDICISWWHPLFHETCPDPSEIPVH